MFIKSDVSSMLGFDKSEVLGFIKSDVSHYVGL